jgi:UDP-GlcNAc:undecaprenyl-phosphate GlcNAc-1-phosphate transferase
VIYLLTLAISFILALALVPVVMWAARRWDVVDRPGGRRQHRGAIPRMGGVAIYGGFVGANLLVRALPEAWLPATTDPNEAFRWLGLMVGATFVVAFGLLDDKYGFKSGPQYLAQIAAGAIAIFFTIFIERINNPFGPGQIVFPWYVIWPLTIFWFMGFINTVNFLDGVDGLAAAVAGVVAVVLAIHMYRTGQASVMLIALALLGSVLGFLLFNWPPAKIFMGSAGSYLLGFTLAALGLIAGARVATVLLVMGLPIMDVAWLIWWRWRHHKPLFQGDRNHLHFRLLDKGFTPRQIVLGYVAFGAVFGAISLMTASTTVKLLALIALALVGGGVILWAAPREEI